MHLQSQRGQECDKLGPRIRRTAVRIHAANHEPALVALTRYNDAASVDFVRTLVMYAVAHHDAWSCTDLHHSAGLGRVQPESISSCEGRVRASDF